MMGEWVQRPEPPHVCAKPSVKYGLIGGVWRCKCNRLWVHRTGWWFGDFPPWFQRTVARWHKARWWEIIKWSGKKSEDQDVDDCDVQS